MKNLPTVIKWIYLLLINTFPFLLNVIFYAGGAMNDLYLFFPVITCLTVLNYWAFKKSSHYIIIQLYIIVCIICSGFASTYLYYHNISDDCMTPPVGMLVVILEVAVVIIITAITTIIKAAINKYLAKK